MSNRDLADDWVRPCPMLSHELEMPSMLQWNVDDDDDDDDNLRNSDDNHLLSSETNHRHLISEAKQHRSMSEFYNER
jgi:hypothetical protein